MKFFFLVLVCVLVVAVCGVTMVQQEIKYVATKEVMLALPGGKGLLRFDNISTTEIQNARSLLTVKFILKSFNQSSWATNELQKSLKTRVTATLAGKVKAECVVKLDLKLNSVFYCLNKYDISERITAPIFAVKFKAADKSQHHGQILARSTLQLSPRQNALRLPPFPRYREQLPPPDDPHHVEIPHLDPGSGLTQVSSQKIITADASPSPTFIINLRPHVTPKSRLFCSYFVSVEPSSTLAIPSSNLRLGKQQLLHQQQHDPPHPLERSLLFTMSINGGTPITADFIGDRICGESLLDGCTSCTIDLSGVSVTRACLSFHELLDPAGVGEVVDQGSLTINFAATSQGDTSLSQLLTAYAVTITVIVHIQPSPFSYWTMNATSPRGSPEMNDNMKSKEGERRLKGLLRDDGFLTSRRAMTRAVECLLASSHHMAPPAILGLLTVTEGGRRVSIAYHSKWKPERVATITYNSSLPTRLRVMEHAVSAAIGYALKHMNISRFPDIVAAVWPGDESILDLLPDRPACPGVTRWPPVLSQNREAWPNNLFVMTPDFSYFTSFEGNHDHGNKEDVWFDSLDRELAAEMKKKKNTKLSSSFSSSSSTSSSSSLSSSSSSSMPSRDVFSDVSVQSRFSPVPLSVKSSSSVFRGKVTKRRWGSLREALLSHRCAGDFLNSNTSRFISKADMCLRHQSIITLPGNGVWSWATKFNLLCNSVSIFPDQRRISGYTWETRPTMGLLPWVHFIPLSTDESYVCEDVKKKVEWMSKNAEAALRIATRGRQVVMKKLGKDSVLRELALLLLQYADIW